MQERHVGLFVEVIGWRLEMVIVNSYLFFGIVKDGLKTPATSSTTSYSTLDNGADETSGGEVLLDHVISPDQRVFCSP